MLEFDPSQRRVLGLDPLRHASVLGAPGTGKSTLIAESFARVLALPGWSEEDLLVVTPGRTVAASLRTAIEQRVLQPLGGTPVRTPVAAAFALVARERAVLGEAAPRLLTGPVHDEVIAWAVTELTAAQKADRSSARSAQGAGEGSPTPAWWGSADAQSVETPRFRAEVRELWRVLDDFDQHPEQLRRLLTDGVGGDTRVASAGAIDSAQRERWEAALTLVAVAAQKLELDRPHEFTASGLLRAARLLLTDAERSVRVPRLILVDNAADLGEGEFGFLAACVNRGSVLWVFGDPDISAGSFQGERVPVLTALASELDRLGVRSLGASVPSSATGASAAARDVQQVVLETVYRHAEPLRGFVRELTERTGRSGVQRRASAAAGMHNSEAEVGKAAEFAPQFARVGSPAEQVGVIAHRLRARKLGLIDGHPVPGSALEWSRMAVICRSRAEAERISRLLAAQQVPTGADSGGMVLREHRIVRDLVILLRHALGLVPVTASDILSLLQGPIGGLDPVAIRRLRGALLIYGRRTAQETGVEAATIAELLQEAFDFPMERALIDSAGGRALRRLGRVAEAGHRTHAQAGTPREVLWAIWEKAALAERWQRDALDTDGARSSYAHRALDAVLGLFFQLQRHEEQASEQPVGELLDEVMHSAVPIDTLAARTARDAVTVTTPQGAMGKEFALVCVLGPQEGEWPNLRTQGSILGANQLEQWLREGRIAPRSRRETLHDELRLFALACSRAERELLVVAVGDDREQPSSFFRLGARFSVAGLPSASLTLRGAVAEMRRRLTLDPGDSEALASLVRLARDEVPGADPGEWYGVRQPSTLEPLVDLEGDPGAFVRVSPSQLDRAETCPLDWAISHFGGGTGHVAAGLGTLVHHALEQATASTDAAVSPEQLTELVLAEWGHLRFESDWESEKAKLLAEKMAQGVAEYLTQFNASSRELVGREAAFEVAVDRALLVGLADRVEVSPGDEATSEIFILDLKTVSAKPSAQELARHAQLQAYQLAAKLGGFVETGVDPAAQPGGAGLLFVHPAAAGARALFVVQEQPPLDPEAEQHLVARIGEAAQTMSGSRFTARIEHHCTDSFQPGLCRIHVIPAVSYE